MKLKPFEWLLIIYQLLIIILITFSYKKVVNPLILLDYHAGIIILITLIMSRVKNQFVRSWYPLLFMGFLFYEINLLDNIIFNKSFDYYISKLDRIITGQNIGITLCQIFPQHIISEIMHFFYFSYYLLIISLGLLIYFLKSVKKFERYLFILLLAFFIHYIFYIIFPVVGPKSYFKNLVPKILPGYFFAPLANFIISIGGIAGAAFPSSHVAISFLIFIYSKIINKRVQFIYFILFTGLAVSTVYIREHYFADVVTGIISGFLCYKLCSYIYDKFIDEEFESAPVKKQETLTNSA